MTVILRDKIAAIVDESVRAGRSPDASTLVNDLLETLISSEGSIYVATPLLETLLMEGIDEPTSPLTPQDFIDIRSQALAEQAAEAE